MDIYHIIKRDYPQLTAEDFESTRFVSTVWVDEDVLDALANVIGTKKVPIDVYTPETAKCIISDEGSGQFISHWDTDTLGLKPTITQADIDAPPTTQEADAILDEVLEKEFKRTTKPSSFDKALAATLFELVNKVRVLEGDSVITKKQFKKYLKGKMG